MRGKLAKIWSQLAPSLLIMIMLRSRDTHMRLSPHLLVLGVALAAKFGAGDAAVRISVASEEAVSQTQPTYASWNIDSSCNRGFHHINFTNQNLLAAARGLRPSKLRFGGSGNDNLIYGLTPGDNLIYILTLNLSSSPRSFMRPRAQAHPNAPACRAR